PGEDFSADVKIGSSSLKQTSIGVATAYWERSDGVMLIKDDFVGYEFAVCAGPLASYVNIPIIVTNAIDSDVKSVLSNLGVKYSIVCGDLEGYGKIMRFASDSDIVTIQDLTIDFVRHADGLNSDVTYITIANPLDITEPKVQDSTEVHFDGEIYHHASTSPGVWPGTEEVSAGVDFEFEIPEGYNYALMHFTLKFQPHEEADLTGERMYAWVFDLESESGAEEQEAFFGTPAGRIEGDYRIVDYDLLLFNDSGKHKIHVEGRETFDGVPIPVVNQDPVFFDLDVRIEKLDNPILPLMKDLSCLAPYATAYHQGVVMASPDYALQYAGYTGCVDCGEPTVDKKAIETANNQSIIVHKDLVKLLGRLAGHSRCEVLGDTELINDLASSYYDNPVHIAIIADTNMVPHYYYPGGDGTEGWGEPGDTFYADINVDYTDAFKDLGEGKINPSYPDLELPIGRFTGYDTQDVSALIARTFFYYDILDTYRGYDQGDVHSKWKDNAYAFLGSQIPVELMYGALFDQIVESMSEGGFVVKETDQARSHRENSDKYQTGSNYIIGGVHGFYYWYVPASRTKYAGGSAYDVAHTRELNFGPSTMFLVSCVTGRIDGLKPENCLALAYMHGGMNAYLGATRSTYGGVDQADMDMRLEPTGAVMLSKLFTEEVMSNDDVGIALRDAKNLYLPQDAGNPDNLGIPGIIYGHYIIHGDPAFNPYEPNNG
ncbi:MAG: hypothetical protein KAJ51_00270, partial [Thermoplasmata archaeon]|nr:hypothetical protein [Thermoplasmata archaeon]